MSILSTGIILIALGYYAYWVFKKTDRDPYDSPSRMKLLFGCYFGGGLFIITGLLDILGS